MDTPPCGAMFSFVPCTGRASDITGAPWLALNHWSTVCPGCGPIDSGWKPAAMLGITGGWNTLAGSGAEEARTGCPGFRLATVVMSIESPENKMLECWNLCAISSLVKFHWIKKS